MNSASSRHQNQFNANALSGPASRSYRVRPKTPYHQSGSGSGFQSTKGIHRHNYSKQPQNMSNGHHTAPNIQQKTPLLSEAERKHAQSDLYEDDDDILTMNGTPSSSFENGSSYPPSDNFVRFESQRSQESCNFSKEHEHYIELLRRNWQTAVDKCSSKANQEPTLPNVMRRVSSGSKLSQLNNANNNQPQTPLSKQQPIATLNELQSATIPNGSDQNASISNDQPTKPIQRTGSSLSNGSNGFQGTAWCGNNNNSRRELTLFYYNEQIDSTNSSSNSLNGGGDSSNKYIDAWLEEQILNQVFQTS